MIVYSNITTASMDIIIYYLYVIESPILIVFSFLLAFSIFNNKFLREQKEYVIFAGSSLFDAIFGLAYFCAGIWRTIIYYTEECKSFA